MKKNKFLQIGAFVLLAAGTISASLSLAWFRPTTKVGNQGETNTMPIDGSSSSGYFAYGDGTSQNPYGIRNPRHLYNLAWLQYLGVFKNKQLYFELADNVNMSGWTLPPIGTEDNPFASYFNGKGYVVSNLTVSNKFIDYNVHPAVVTSSTFEQPHILGFFGVIGDYNDDITNYSSSTNQFANTGLYNITVKTSVKDSLMGIAAGYVNDDDLTDNHIMMENVLVDGSRLDISTDISGSTTGYAHTDNISDYTLVGYTNDVKNINKATKTLYDVTYGPNKEFNATEDGNSNGWGGSLNMINMYDRITDIRKSTTFSSTNYSYSWKKNHIIAPGGEKNTADDTIDPDYDTDVGETIRAFRHSNANYQKAGNFVNTHRGDDSNYNYLQGGTFNVYNYQKYYHHSGYRITVDGTNYLTATNFANNAAVSASTQDSAIVWTIPTTGTTGTIYTTRSSTAAYANYYLSVSYANGVILRTDQTNATTWTIDRDSSGHIRYSYNGYYLNYNNGWVMSPLPTEPTAPTAPTAPTITEPIEPSQSDYMFSAGDYQISDGTDYLKYSGSGYATFSAGQSQYPWRFTNLNGTTKIYTVIDGTNYYVVRSSNGSGYVSLSTNEESGTSFTNSGSNQFYAYSNSRYYYLRNYYGTLYTTRSNKNTALNLSNCTTFTLTSMQGTVNNVAYQAALSQYQTDLTAYNAAWQQYNNEYAQYERDQAKYEEDYAQYQTDYAQYQTDHANWVTTMNNLHPIIVSYAEIDGPDIDRYYDRTEYGMEYTSNDTTFFPLNVVKDDEQTHTATTTNIANYYPKDSNTGYVTVGSNLNSSKTELTKDESSMRVSRYNASQNSQQTNIKNSFKTGDTKLSNVKTVNASGNVVDVTASVAANYEKYNDSKTAFENILTSDAAVSGSTRYLYGLHFMDATISMDHILNADWVSILGEEHTNFELPVNSIDFNLKETGYINFFAGTYFTTTVNSFFSLHKIVRSGNKITNIFEIEEIFKDTSTTAKNRSYVYKLKDKSGNITYSCPYIFDALGNRTSLVNGKNPDDNNLALSELPAGYVSSTSSLFKTSQIKNNSLLQYYAYYFEIPMNAGEYCLGSVPGGTGGYLLYLDIGANAAKTQRTTFYEKFTLVENAYSYPLGVVLQTLPEPSTYKAGVAVINVSSAVDYSDSVCMVIMPQAKGEFEMDRNAGDVALSRAQTNKAPPVYSGDNITLVHESGSSTPISIQAESSHSYETKRMQYYDYFVNSDTLIITTITDTRIDGASSYTRTINQSVYNGSDPYAENALVNTYIYDGTTDQRSSMKVYRTENGVKYSTAEIINQSVLAIADSNLSTTKILVINLLQENGIGFTETTTLIADVDANNVSGTYYLFSQYLIEIVPEEGIITVTIKEYVTGKTIYIGTIAVTGTAQEPIVINP